MVCNSINNIGTEQNLISCYPNPTLDNLTIQLNTQASNGSIILTNIIGQVVYTEVVSKQSGNSNYPLSIINCQLLPAGIYFVKVVTDKGSVVKKMVKE